MPQDSEFHGVDKCEAVVYSYGEQIYADSVEYL